MIKDPNREPLHPAYINRRLMDCLPREVEPELRQNIIALFSFSGQYMMKPELEAGRISFSGVVSYSQLAEFSGIHPDTAKWRCEEVRDRWHILQWRRSKYGIKFQVSYTANRLTDSGTAGVRLGNGWVTESSQGTEKSSQGTETAESGYRCSESGYGCPPLSLNCPKELSIASVLAAEVDDHQQVLKSEGSRSTANSKAKSNPDSAKLVTPSIPVGSLRQQQQEDAPAPPVRRCGHGMPLKVRCGHCLREQQHFKQETTYTDDLNDPALLAELSDMLQREIEEAEENKVRRLEKCVSA